MSERGRHLPYLPALDGLRAIAVAAVFVYHADREWLPGGYLGVDVFFVISGFLITGLLLGEHASTGRISLPAFWVRRARRLLPAAWLVLLAVVVAGAAWSSPSRLAELRGDVIAGLLYVVNWRWIVTETSYFDLFTGPSPLRHLWSLAIEEQFYLAWPVVAALALRLGRGRSGPLLAVIGAGTVASVAAMALLAGDDPSRAYFGTDTRVFALLLGAGLAVVLSRDTRRPPGWVAWPAVAVLAVFFVVAADDERWMYRGGFLAVAATTAALVASTTGERSSPVARVLSRRPLVAVGRVSYGLYLWHWPVIVFLTRGRIGVDGVALTTVHLGVTVVLTLLSYALVERPVRYGALPRRAVALGFPAAAAVVAVVAVVATAAGERAPSEREAAPVVELEAQAAPVVTTPQRVLLVGDSVAWTVQDTLGAAFAARGAAFRSATWLGCGVIPGAATGRQRDVVKWAATCRDEALPKQDEVVRSFAPDLVVWFSYWETSSRVLDGRYVEFGAQGSDEVWLRLLTESIDRLAAGGAKVAILANPPAVQGDEHVFDATYNERIAHLRRLFAQAVAQRPGTAYLVDFAGLVCGNTGTCPDRWNGIRLRPRDGQHFDERGAGAIAGPLADLILSRTGSA